MAQSTVISDTVPASERIQKRQARSLALIAGYLDGYGLLVLGIFVSFMSGNTTTAGLKTGQGDLLVAAYPFVAIVCFVTGSLLGNLLTHSKLRQAHRLLFSLIAVLFLFVLLFVLHVGHAGLLRIPSIAALALGMGMTNPALERIGAENVSVTFVTGTLSRLGGHLALALKGAPVPGSEGAWDTQFYRARITAGLWASFIIGAVLSGIVMSFTETFALVPGIAAMLALALFSGGENLFVLKSLGAFARH
jgi:uncharacterized membrane protein YoaK (UPF0700 family)